MSGQKHKQYNDERIEKAIEELDGYRAIQQRILRLKEQKLRLEANYCGIKAVDYEKLKVQGGAIKNVLVETAIKWAELDAEIAKKQVECEQMQFEIECKVQQLPFEEQQVIVLYFINRLPVERIAIRMETSPETVKRLKKRGLRHYAEVGA